MSQLYADILVGPTASGKSAVAQFLAQQTPPRPIISADSMAIYRGMDIGTAKPTAAERAAVPSFGFDLAPPDQPFSAGNYLAAIRAAIPAITAAQATPIVVGGTGLYVKALTLGLDPPPSNPELRAQAENILQTHGLPALQAATRALNPAEYAKLRDPENPRRVIRAYELLAAGHPLPRPSDRPRPPMAGLLLPSDELHARIARRARQMFRPRPRRRSPPPAPKPPPPPHRPPRHRLRRSRRRPRWPPDRRNRHPPSHHPHPTIRQAPNDLVPQPSRRPLGRSHPPRRHRTPRQQSPPNLVRPRPHPPVPLNADSCSSPPPPAVVYRALIKGCQHE